MPLADKFHCSLVTPEQAVLEVDCLYAEIPAHDGQLGIAPNRAPLLAKLGVGELRLEIAGGGVVRYVLDGGFAQMRGNQLTLLSERAWPAEELDTEDAKAQLKEASARIAVSDEDFQRRQHDLALARQMVHAAEAAHR